MAQVDTLLDGSERHRDKLLRAALYLFARQGLDVPLRDINELAGQRNASALHYHFGGRPELVQAIIDRYRLSDEEHAAIEAELRSGSARDPRRRAKGSSTAAAAWLATPDGRDYIRVVFQFVIRLPLRQHLLEGTEPPSLASVRAQADLIHEALPDLPEHLVRERAVASFDLVLLQVAERARIIDDEDGRGLLAEDEWKANLVDMATGFLPHAPLDVLAADLYRGFTTPNGQEDLFAQPDSSGSVARSDSRKRSSRSASCARVARRPVVERDRVVVERDRTGAVEHSLSRCGDGDARGDATIGGIGDARHETLVLEHPQLTARVRQVDLEAARHLAHRDRTVTLHQPQHAEVGLRQREPERTLQPLPLTGAARARDHRAR